LLILLDMAMPVMSGMDFLEEFRQLPAAVHASTIIVVLAVSMTSADLGRLEEYPVAGTASKPLTKEKLSPVLQLHFSKQNG
jgi:CheY-like chemotaxis protein